MAFTTYGSIGVKCWVYRGLRPERVPNTAPQLQKAPPAPAPAAPAPQDGTE